MLFLDLDPFIKYHVRTATPQEGAPGAGAVRATLRIGNIRYVATKVFDLEGESIHLATDKIVRARFDAKQVLVELFNSNVVAK